MYRWKLNKSKDLDILNMVKARLDILEAKNQYQYPKSSLSYDYTKRYWRYLKLAEFGETWVENPCSELYL